MSGAANAPKRVVISGVGPGTGRALALAFATEGAHLVLSCRNPDRISDIAEEARDKGATSVLTAACDITDAHARSALVQRIRDEHGRLDVLVNNAFTTGHIGPLVGSDPAQAWRAAFAVNVFGTMGLSVDLMPLLAEANGCVISIGTLAAHKAQPNIAGYGASKAALVAAMRSLAVEVATHGVRVNMITPSHIDGPNLALGTRFAAQARGVDEEVVRSEYMDEGLLRHITTPEEIADCARFLASDAARSMTGQNLHLNNGQWLP